MYKADMPTGKGTLRTLVEVTERAEALEAKLEIERMKAMMLGKPEPESAQYVELSGDFNSEGVIEGFARMKVPGRLQYEGDWKAGLPSGQGQADYIDVELGLEDQVVGNLHKAAYLRLSKVTYAGGWENGQWHGDGQINFEKLTEEHVLNALGETSGRSRNVPYVIRAQFRHGKLHGNGNRYFKVSGKTLEGKWEDGSLVQGKCSNRDGTYYKGDWCGGRPHGMGTKWISQSKKYTGMFLLGRPWGYGKKISVGSDKD